MRDTRPDINRDFKCLNCGSLVLTTRVLAGVGNRNHCPYCLWSRHLDLFEAGDRLAACKAPMRPVGLTLKRSRNKYARTSGGELMLVHLCTACQRVSINRIAADDIPEAILEVFQSSLTEPAWLGNQIAAGQIRLLGSQAFDSLCQQIYGRSLESELPITPKLKSTLSMFGS